MTNEERLIKIKEREKQIAERDLSDLKKLLEKPEGRRFVHKILMKAETFGNRPTDRREIGLMIFNDIMNITPETYLQMRREYKSELISLRKQFPVDPDGD